MSFEPDNIEHEATVKELLERNNQLLMALIIILSDAQDIDYLQLLNDPELT